MKSVRVVGYFQKIPSYLQGFDQNILREDLTHLVVEVVVGSLEKSLAGIDTIRFFAEGIPFLQI